MIRNARSFSVVLMTLAAVTFIACSNGTSNAQSSPKPKQAKALIPYKVINREEVGNDKLSIDVRVDLVDGRLPTKVELGAVSTHLVKDQHHKRKFVGFYLPAMKVDAGYFATAHHLPNMEVKILEFNLPEKYRKLLKQ